MDVLSYALSKKYTDEQIAEQKLKVAKVEKELNDYKSVMAQVNINQEAKQKASGYGIVSLPKNAANGQISVTLKGKTATNLVKNGDFANGTTYWGAIGGTISVVDGKLQLTENTSQTEHYARQNLYMLGIKPYVGMKVFVRAICFNGGQIVIYNRRSDGSYQHVDGNRVSGVGVSYAIITITDIHSTPELFIRLYGKTGIYTGTGATYQFDDVFAIDLTALGLADKTADEINKMFPYWFDSTKSTVCGFRIRSVSQDESQESTAYVLAKDAEGKILELRSLPNGVKDEFRVSEGKLIQRIGHKENVASGTVINYADMADGGVFYAWNDDGETQAGVKGDTLTIDATQLIYQLAEPVEIPVQVSGTLLSYPSGTVYVENVVADAGLYSDGITVLHQDLPIKSIEKISKIDYETGLETILDASKAVIASDKLSFTHPDLKDGDIVFFIYEYDKESTIPEIEVEFYDSRYVVKDSATGKFYKWSITVTNGTPSIQLTEV